VRIVLLEPIQRSSTICSNVQFDTPFDLKAAIKLWRYGCRVNGLVVSFLLQFFEVIV
jgi:hypothetical protein